MPRKKIHRRIDCSVEGCIFKPVGIPLAELTEQTLYADELEAIRLADFLGLQQIEAASRMAVSRQTFANILKAARHKISRCLIQSQALRLAPELVEHKKEANHE